MYDQLEIKYPDPSSTYDCKIFDSADVVHSLPVKTVSTFGDYADILFHLMSKPSTGQTCRRCLGYIKGKKSKRINQREERRRSETKGDKWNQASIKVENISARYYQQGRAILIPFWLKK